MSAKKVDDQHSEGTGDSSNRYLDKGFWRYTFVPCVMFGGYIGWYGIPAPFLAFLDKIFG